MSELEDKYKLPKEVKEANDIINENQKIAKQGLKLDDGKLKYSLLPKGSIREILKVLMFGAKKYSPGNWKKVSNPRERYYDALMRHLDDWYNGEKHDSESGLLHLAHAGACLLFLIWFDKKENK